MKKKVTATLEIIAVVLLLLFMSAGALVIGIVVFDSFIVPPSVN